MYMGVFIVVPVTFYTEFLNIARYIYMVENWIAYNLVAKLILICGKK